MMLAFGKMGPAVVLGTLNKQCLNVIIFLYLKECSSRKKTIYLLLKLYILLS